MDSLCHHARPARNTCVVARFNLVVPPSVLSVEPGLSSELELNVVSASRFVRITFLLPKCDNQSIQLVDTPDSVDGIVWWDNSTNTELAPSSTTLKKVTPTDVFSPTNALYVAIAQGAVWIPFTFCRRPATVVVRRLGAIPEHDLIATHYDRLVDHSFDASKDTTVFSIPFRLSVKTDVDRRTTDDTVDVRIFVDHGSVGIAPGDLHDGVDVGDHDATAGDETSLEHSVELNNILLTELSSRWTEVRYTATRTHMNVTVFFSLVAYRPSDGGHRRATMELSSKFLTRIILPKTEVEECIEAKNVALKEAKQAQGQAEKASGEFNACDEKRKDCKKKAPEQVRKCEADCRREKAVLDGEINRHLGIVAKCRETRDKDVSKCQKGREKDVYWMKIKIKQLKTCWEELSRAVVEEQLWSADLIKIANRCAYADPDLLE